MIDSLKKIRIVPVVTINDADKAPGLAQALIDGGLPIAEITLRTPSSVESLRLVAENKSILVGAGSLRNETDVQKVVSAGAKFLVSAGFSAAIARESTKLSIPYFPGVATPTEILQALDTGISTLKFFPAESLGGVSMLQAISAPFPGITFMPTGGINLTNVKKYLELPQVIAVGGSWMVPPQIINDGNFEKIKALTVEAVEAVK